VILKIVIILKFIASLFMSHILFVSESWAADPFANVQLSPTVKTFLVLKDVNVRGKPKNRSARLGRLRKNERVTAIGKAKRTKWIAVKKGGKNLGFVYGKALVPVIDGKLIKPISSNIVSQKNSENTFSPCKYKIKFVGKVKVEGSLQITSDYNLEMECDYKKRTIKINATMFLTELPYLDNKQPIFQINVDLYNIPIGAEDMFSTIILYYALENQIKFDRVNKEPLRSKERILNKEAGNLSEVLKGAVVMAHQSWGPIIWSELAKVRKN